MTTKTDAVPLTPSVGNPEGKYRGPRERGATEKARVTASLRTHRTAGSLFWLGLSVVRLDPPPGLSLIH
ncbi:MAG: hypothetical protein QUU85_18815, partial [Candidatus Eisenbacteria bacterium]|nr:hypothetical protein [Candidatus Eisenbacteria bacterium]